MLYKQDDLWNTSSLEAFSNSNYDKMITSSCLQESEKYLKLSRKEDDYIDGFEARKLHTGNKVPTTYFVPSSFIPEMPILLEETTTIRNNGNCYHLITKAKTLKIESQNMLGFRGLIDDSGIKEHTCPLHYTLYKIIVLWHRLGKGCARIVTESAFGKDKYIEMIRLLINEINVLSDPTVAKLISRVQHDKFVVLNEMPAEITGANFRLLCNALIRIGDDGKILDNRARATTGTSETANISKLSVLFIHNPLHYYHEKGLKGFEDIFPYNVDNRYMSFKLEGYTQAQFTPQLNSVEYSKYFAHRLKAWIKTAKYYEENWHELTNRYGGIDTERYTFPKKEERLKTQFERLAVAISQYADTKEEYAELCEVAWQAHKNQVEEGRNKGEFVEQKPKEYLMKEHRDRLDMY